MYICICIYIYIHVYTYLHNIYLRRYFLGSVFLVELAPAVRGSCANQSYQQFLSHDIFPLVGRVISIVVWEQKQISM